MEYQSGDNVNDAYSHPLTAERDFVPKRLYLLINTFPTLLLILLSPLYLHRYYQQPIRILSGALLWIKFILVVAIVAVEFVSFVILRSREALPALLPGGPISNSALGCLASVLIAALVNVEHRRALQSSALTGVYLFLSLISDALLSGVFLSFAQTHTAGRLAIVAAVMKLALLILLEMPKRRRIADPAIRHDIADEETSGFWSRSFLVWLNKTLLLGFQKIITVDDLGSLGLELSSKALSDRLELALRQHLWSRFCLMKACFVTFSWPFFQSALPRLSFAGLTFAQPMYLRRVIVYIGDEKSSKLISCGLVGAGGLIFLGIAISRSAINGHKARLATMIRGAIVPLISKKTLYLPGEIANETAALTLMSTDVQGLTSGITRFHDIWVSFIEICIGIFLLSIAVGDAIYLVFIPVIASTILAVIVGNLYISASAAWNANVEQRVSQTTKALFQIKSIKMLGIEHAVSSSLQQLRVTEISAFKWLRLLVTIGTTISVAAYASTPITAIGGGLFWTSLGEKMTPVNAFTILAIATLVTNPLMVLFQSFPKLQETWACASRIQAFLVQEISNNVHGGGNDDHDLAVSPNLEKISEPQTEGRNIQLAGAFISPTETTSPVILNTTFTIERAQVTVVVGPVGCGKSTLIRALLGEASVCQGQLWRKDCNIAYCGQSPWLRNVSIRKNIIGPNRFDPVWYEVVLNACALNDDLQRLPFRDSTKVGNNGSKLSGGQKRRVALARALYSRSPIILLDDVFSGLDATMAQNIHTSLFGAKGVLRRSASSAVFTTHTASFIKAADQALIFEGDGTVTVQPQPSTLVLPSDLVTQMEQGSQPGATSNQAPDSRSVANSALPPESEFLEMGAEAYVRQRGDLGLYRYFARLTSSWKIVLWAICVAFVVASERLPEIFVRIWLETDPTNNSYFTTYAAIGASTCVFTPLCLWYFYMRLIPANSLKVHKILLDSVMGATLSFLTSTDTGSIINRFSQDMTLLTNDLPYAFYQALYLGTYVTYDTAIIVSGVKYAAILMPFVFVVLYAIPAYNLRTSRQTRLLDIESKVPLYSLFAEMSSGVEHIRAFGWESSFVDESIEALDYSQKPFYYRAALQSWLELAMDLSIMVLAVTLVIVATVFKDTTSQAALGLSLLNLITFSNMLNFAVAAWTLLETALGAVARLRTFLSKTPNEEQQGEVSLPSHWPHTGTIVFSNVTAKYNPEDVTPALRNVSLTLQAGQKIGISGRSGSGKTTLLLTILRLLSYTGTITIDGIDISAIPSQQLRSRITTISQDSIRLEGAVRENLLPYSGQSEDGTITEDIIFEALDQTELTDIIKARGGLNAPLSAMEFSEGHMQLLCLARAIVHNTCTQSRVVLLDEPTSSLDLETDNRIQAMMRDAFLDCTMVMVSHRPETLWDANVRLEVKDRGVSRITAKQHPPQNW